ncbi:MAG TPA: hypothetical protein VGP93_20940 [Polyangiaceae bacterium]|jgi:hypothetical protein|nr:hypothetical protein [Polyangiaceae bacterium]
MADSGEQPSRKNGVLPPPPGFGEEQQEVAVPPLEPPPASLEAMVRNRQRPARPSSSEKSPWLVLVALFVLGMLLMMYFRR